MKPPFVNKLKGVKLPVPSSGYYSMARSNLAGAKRIIHTLAPEAERNADPCVQFLLGWAADGFLKAFLKQRGVDDKVLRNIGHDLTCGFEEALVQGLTFASSGRCQLVMSYLAPAHREMYFRYLPTNLDGTDKSFSFVLPSLAIPALDALDEAVWPSVQIEFNNSLEAHSVWQPAL